MVKWAIGLTTVPERKSHYLKQTIHHLHEGGFDTPHLFVDGANDGYEIEQSRGYTVTRRFPRIGAYGNFLLGLLELLIRNPACDRYIMFQDDITCYRNLRQYLETFPMDDHSRFYWNLYTQQTNEELRPNRERGWYTSNQRGIGALALCFSRMSVIHMLSKECIIAKPCSPAPRCSTNVDGAVVTGMGIAGFRELVHYPSLVQHEGVESIVGNHTKGRPMSYLSPQFDAMSLLAK